MHEFLIRNRDELIARCEHTIRPQSGRMPNAERHPGVSLLLDQLTRTLVAEHEGLFAESMRISGDLGASSTSEIGTTAAAHGKELLASGYTIDDVVHGYGALCQAITGLAAERGAAFPVEHFRTLNRCLDNAIAEAVTAFSLQREISLAREQEAAANQRLGILIHEFRNALGTATLAVDALQLSNMPIGGATGSVLKRSLLAMRGLVDRAFGDVRRGRAAEQEFFDVAGFIEEAKVAAQLAASSMHRKLVANTVEPGLGIRGDRELLLAALGNILHNAFKFTLEGTAVVLHVSATQSEIQIDVSDHCGGLPVGGAEDMFMPFRQRSGDKSGLGLGLTIARQSIEINKGTLTVRDVPGTGCVFSMRMPRQGGRHARGAARSTTTCYQGTAPDSHPTRTAAVTSSNSSHPIPSTPEERQP